MSTSLPTLEELTSDSSSPFRGAARRLRNSRIMFWFSLFCMGSFIVFCLAGLLLPWQQVSIGKGKVIAYAPQNRRQTIESPMKGRIARWYVSEGESIKKGQPIVELSDIDPNIIERMQTQYEALEKNLKAYESALKISRLNLERQRTLSKKGIVSRRDYELAQLEVNNYESEVSSARAKFSDMEVKLSRQLSQTVRADQDGILMRIYAPQGGVLVSQGERLAMLVPDTEDKAVQLYISGNDLPLVEPGRKVRLQFEGWPAVQFSGWPSVAIGTFGGVVKYVDHADDGQGNYRVLVFPDPDDAGWPSSRFLRQGVQTVGWILLDEVSLGWELWRQFNGFPKQVSTMPDTQKESINIPIGGVKKK